jgi:hypothetical protein
MERNMSFKIGSFKSGSNRYTKRVQQKPFWAYAKTSSKFLEADAILDMQKRQTKKKSFLYFHMNMHINYIRTII